MNQQPRKVWQVIGTLWQGLTQHHVPAPSTILRKLDRTLSLIPKDYAQAFKDFYVGTFSRLEIASARTVLNLIPNHEIYRFISHSPTLKELLDTLFRLPNHKVAGENGLTTDALKSLAKLVSHNNLDSLEVRPIYIILRLLQSI